MSLGSESDALFSLGSASGAFFTEARLPSTPGSESQAFSVSRVLLAMGFGSCAFFLPGSGIVKHPSFPVSESDVSSPWVLSTSSSSFASGSFFSLRDAPQRLHLPGFCITVAGVGTDRGARLCFGASPLNQGSDLRSCFLHGSWFTSFLLPWPLVRERVSPLVPSFVRRLFLRLAAQNG